MADAVPLMKKVERFKADLTGHARKVRNARTMPTSDGHGGLRGRAGVRRPPSVSGRRSASTAHRIRNQEQDQVQDRAVASRLAPHNL